MPNVWTHIIFAEDLCKKIGREDLLETSAPLLNYGAQGPDPFFYHHFWPLAKDQQVSEAGMKLHTEQCGPFLLNMIKKGRTMENQVQAFILGYVSHHSLDRNTHPYIHYRAGYEKNKHQKLEVNIDTLMLKKHRGLDSWKSPAYKKFSLQLKKKPIAHLLESLIDEYYPEMSSSFPRHYILQSYRDMKQAQTILFDPWGWKNKVLGSMVSSFSHQPLSDEKDYLNEQKNLWRHPATNEAIRLSFLELYERAFSEAAELFSMILDYWDRDESYLLHNIEEILGNISYDTGLPLSLNYTNVYSDPIV